MVQIVKGVAIVLLNSADLLHLLDQLAPHVLLQGAHVDQGMISNNLV